MLNNILVIAHRGYSSKYPESTELAYIKSIELGVDFIEADIQLSKDGHFVVFHDYDLSRVTDGEGLVCDFTLQELRQFNVRAEFGNKFGFQRIATLEDVIKIAKQSNVKVCLELKDISSRNIESYEDIIVPFLIEHDFMDMVVINLPNTKESDRFTENCLNKNYIIPIAYDFSIEEYEIDKINEFIKKCLNYNIKIVEYEYSKMSKDVVIKLKNNGISIWAWTINEEDDMLLAIKMGVDGILTDDPHKLCKIIGRI